VAAAAAAEKCAYNKKAQSKTERERENENDDCFYSHTKRAPIK
jgi:hypothetical protein